MVKVKEASHWVVAGAPLSRDPSDSLNNSYHSDFVVLSHSSVSSSTNSGMFSSPSLTCEVNASSPNTNPADDMQMSTATTISVLSDLSPDEIPRRMQDLLQENAELKETLQQNNLAMKQQFSTLKNWQEEVKRSHELHKMKFEESRQIIAQLREENESLRAGKQSETPKMQSRSGQSQIEEMKGTIGDLMVRLESAERARRQLGIDNERLTRQKSRAETQIDVMSEQLAEMTAVNEDLKIKLERQLAVTAPTVDSLLQDFSIVTHPEALGPNSRVFPQHTSSQDSSANNSSEHTTMVPGKAIKMPVSTSTDIQMVQTPFMVAEELQHSESSMTAMSSCLQKYEDRCESLEQWLGTCMERLESLSPDKAEVVDQLRCEITNMKKMLLTERDWSHKDRQDLTDTRKQFDKLLRNYEDLLRRWETYQQEQTDKEKQSGAYYDLQTKGYNEKVDKMTAQIMSLEEMLHARGTECDHLKKRMVLMQREVEGIPILRAQVEVYQSDFQMERKGREEMAQERDKLKEDVRHLQSRNQQYVDELETYQRTQFTQIQHRESPVRTSPPMEEGGPSTPNLQSPTNEMFYCPKCNMAFTAFQPLENHVNRCLDEE